MGAFSVGSAAVGALAILWVGLAAAVAIGAARRYRMAQQVLGAARANARLLELMPARPLAIWPDGRIEADERLARDLGLEVTPSTFGQLSGEASGIVPEDLHTLHEK